MKNTETLQERFDRVRHEPSDISAHTGLLYDLACQCDHVTEMGVRSGVSTTFLYHALAHAKRKSQRPRILICYDIHACSCSKDFERFAQGPRMPSFEFHQTSSLLAYIDPTEMLFIDTLHAYAQLVEELDRHWQRVKRWIVLHDTTSFGTHDEGNIPGPGIWQAVEEFVDEHPFEIETRDTKQNGLTVLRRLR